MTTARISERKTSVIEKQIPMATKKAIRNKEHGDSGRIITTHVPSMALLIPISFSVS
jgi:hypothetical protein